MALPRVKAELARAAFLGREERARMPERAEEGRRSIVDMMGRRLDLVDLVGWQLVWRKFKWLWFPSIKGIEKMKLSA